MEPIQMPRVWVRIWLHLPLLAILADLFYNDSKRNGLHTAILNFIPVGIVMALIQFAIWRLERSRFFHNPIKYKVATFVFVVLGLSFFDLTSSLMRHKNDWFENLILGVVVGMTIVPFFLFFGRNRKQVVQL